MMHTFLGSPIHFVSLNGPSVRYDVTQKFRWVTGIVLWGSNFSVSRVLMESDRSYIFSKGVLVFVVFRLHDGGSNEERFDALWHDTGDC